jgi:MFS family permease
MQGRATGLSDAEIDSKDDIELAAPGESAPQEPTALNRKNPLAVYDTRRKRVAFWAAFLTFTVALAIASDTTYLYLSFATSFFAQNSLLGTIGLLTSVLGAVTQPFWGKLADMSARSVSLLASLLLFVLGYVICAAATSVKAIAAGQVIYNIGPSRSSHLATILT